MAERKEKRMMQERERRARVHYGVRGLREALVATRQVSSVEVQTLTKNEVYEKSVSYMNQLMQMQREVGNRVIDRTVIPTPEAAAKAAKLVLDAMMAAPNANAEMTKKLMARLGHQIKADGTLEPLPAPAVRAEVMVEGETSNGVNEDEIDVVNIESDEEVDVVN